jgi:prefoldin subunit 5
MTVTPESGTVIFVAIAASNRQIRGEMNGLHAEIGRLRERMGKLEGLLEGLREAVAGRKAA